MDRIDPTKAAAVWQRVHSSAPPSRSAQALLTLIHDELADGTLYQQLARHFTGARSTQLLQMAKQEFSHAACLKGMYQLIAGEKADVPAPKLAPDTPEAILRRCYGREMHCLAQYEAHSTDPDYGGVFTQLAKQEQEHCRQLLEILGQFK